MYVISNGKTYIGINNSNVATSVSNINKAIQFTEEKKAINYRDNLKSTLKKFNWRVVRVKDETESVEQNCENTGEYTYVETELEKSGFDISLFFNETIGTVSQLRSYVDNMNHLEQEYNKKILDIRHYIRDENTKLNAVQMQRIGYFLQQVERERYECKSNKAIAEVFLEDLNRLGDIRYLEDIRRIRESKYKPRVLTYELLDEIVGKRRIADEKIY